MMITEEFSFPIITGSSNSNCNNVVHLTVLPPLWTTTSSAARSSDRCCCTKRNKLFTRSFSQVESQVLVLKATEPQLTDAYDTDPEAEEKMDMLWEDFNNNELQYLQAAHAHADAVDHDAAAAAAAAAATFSSSPSSPTCSSPAVEIMIRSSSSAVSSLSSLHPHQVSPNRKNFSRSGREFEAADQRCASFRQEAEIRSNLMKMIPATANKKRRKKKEKKLLQESVLKMMRKLFLLKRIGIATFKKKLARG